MKHLNASPDLHFRTALCVALTSLVTLVSAQWSLDPAAPLAVSTAVGAAQQVKAMSDGTDGWYIFWRDKRTDGTHYEIFGQHLDAAGNALWAPNGQVVVPHSGRTFYDYDVQRMVDGRFLFAYISGANTSGDTLRAVLLDTDFDPVWPEPVMVTRVLQGSVIYLSSIAMVPRSDGAIIGWYDIYTGGSMGVNVARITMNGDLPWAPNGYAIPGASYGPFGLLPDGADGVMVNWRNGNGIGAGYGTMRVDSSGVNAWPANVAPQAGAPGFGGDHALSSTAGKDLLLAYSSNANNVYLARVDTAGTQVFAPPVLACTNPGSQKSVSMMHEDGITTLVWADNRPPASNYDLYMQRLDEDGNLLLASEGVLVMHINTYVPTTGVTGSLDGGCIGTFTGNVFGYSAMCMSAEGLPLWDEAVRFCTPPFNPADKQWQFPDGEGGVVSFWRSTNGGVFGGRIYADGQLGDHTGIGSVDGRTTMRIFPNPANERVRIKADEALLGQRAAIELFDATGKRVHVEQVNAFGALQVMDLPAELKEGLYLLMVRVEGQAPRAARVVVKR